MKPCINCIRYSLLVLLFISCIVTLVVLGLDLDLLLNGPEYLSKVLTNIVNRLHKEEIVNQEQLTATLLEARQSLWVHIPMVMVVVLSVVLLMLNMLGCAGACLLSYSLLSGFTMFMFVNFVLFTALALWIFVNNMEDSVMESFVTDKISQYNQSEGIFNLVIDTVQRDLQCCGFRSSSDWSGSFPASCCPDTCAEEECLEVGQECLLQRVYTSNCLEMIRSQLLQPSSMVGLIGVTFLVVVAVVGVTTLTSLCLCLAARKRSRRGHKLHSSKDYKDHDGSMLELMQPRFGGK
eukprot:GFUD01001018.1.p1 GENE.GFUD01001018.1~~GFUD01001018.1.p1  ORF type:complete len:293 (-),score=63.28 GFUD01001018.1:59-937(-)